MDDHIYFRWWRSEWFLWSQSLLYLWQTKKQKMRLFVCMRKIGILVNDWLFIRSVRCCKAVQNLWNVYFFLLFRHSSLLYWLKSTYFAWCERVCLLPPRSIFLWICDLQSIRFIWCEPYDFILMACECGYNSIATQTISFDAPIVTLTCQILLAIHNI